MQEFGAVSGVEAHEFCFNGGADHHTLGAVLRGVVGDPLAEMIASEIGFIDVGDEQHRLGGQQAHFAQQRARVVVEIQCADRATFIEGGQENLVGVGARAMFFVTGLGGFLGAVEALGYGVEISEREFDVDDFNVGNRVDAAGDMGDVVVLEAAHDMRNGIGLANVGEEFIAEAFAFRGARDQARDVDELHARRHHALRFDDGGEFVEARVRHGDDADIGFDGAERIVLRRDGGRGQRIEQRGLADIGQADDTAFETHRTLPYPLATRWLSVFMARLKPPSMMVSMLSSTAPMAASMASRSTAGGRDNT